MRHFFSIREEVNFASIPIKFCTWLAAVITSPAIKFNALFICFLNFFYIGWKIWPIFLDYFQFWLKNTMEASFLHGSSAIHTQHKPRPSVVPTKPFTVFVFSTLTLRNSLKKKHWPSTVDRHWQLRALEDACNQCQATVHSKAFHKVLEKEGKCMCQKIRRTLHKVGFQSSIVCSKLASAKRNGTNGFMVPQGISIRNWKTVEGFFHR